jgi:hypothetical protein
MYGFNEESTGEILRAGKSAFERSIHHRPLFTQSCHRQSCDFRNLTPKKVADSFTEYLSSYVSDLERVAAEHPENFKPA